VQATNWRAEHAIRPAVVTRKAWGGNRTWDGAATQQILASVLRTADQQHRDPVELLVGLLQVPVPTVADLHIPARRHERRAPVCPPPADRPPPATGWSSPSSSATRRPWRPG
jgi:hypothetical protein